MGSKGIIFTLDAILTISFLAIFIILFFSVYRGYYYSFYEYDVRIREYLLVSDLLKSLEKQGVLTKLAISKEQKRLLVENSVVLGESYVTPFLPNQRAICRSAEGSVHVVWRYNDTVVKYARSTDGGKSFQVIDLDNSSYTKGTPHISCDKNFVTIGYRNYTGLVIALSEDNGESFSFRSPRTQNVDEVIVERRGEKIYVVYKDSLDPSSIIFFSSNDSGNSWSNDVTLFEGEELYFQGQLQYYFSFSLPSFTVEGNGSDTDKLSVVAVEYYWDPWWSTFSIYFRFSNNSGASWTPLKFITSSSSQIFSITFISHANSLYLAFTNESFSIFLVNSSDYGENWSNATQISKGSFPEFYAAYPTITFNSFNLPTIFYSKNIGINSRNFLIPDGVINLAYKAENSTATSPDGATIPFSSAEYALVNDSDLIRLNVSPIDNSAFTKFVFNLSKLNIFSRDVINLTYALQGYYSGDLAQTKYKFHTSWLTGENMNTVEQYYVRSFSGLSLSGVIRDGVFQLGTAQQNTSVGEDYTFINYVYVNVTYRLPLQIAYAGFFRDEWKDEDFLGKEAEDNLFLNSRSAYAGNSIELVYGRGRMPPYKIIYALVRDWEEIAISSLAQVDKWRIELAVEPIQINQARHMRSDTHSVNGLNTYKLGTTVSDQPVYIQGDCTDTGSFYLGIRVWRRLSNQTEIEITNGVAVGIVSLLVGRTEIVTTLSSTWQAPNFSLDPTDSLVIRVYGGLSTPPTSLLATFTTEILGAHKLLSSTWKINYRVRRIVFDNPPTSCFDFLFGTSQNDSYVENLTYELSPIWLNYSYNWEGSEVFMARTISLITNFTEIHKEGGLANKLEVESGTPYSVLKVIVRGLRSMDLNLPENTSLSINCEVLDLLDRKLGWSISISPTILVNSSYQDFNVCNITIPEIVNIQKYRVNVTLSNLTYSTSKYGISEFYLFKPAYIKLYLAR